MYSNVVKWLDWLEMVITMPDIFQEFSTSFKDQYFPLDDANNAYNKLHSMRLKGSFADYCAEFDTIELSLPESHPKDLKNAFIYGFKSNLRPQ